MDDDARYDYAVSLHDRGEFKAAIKEYDYLLERYPDDHVARYERALSLKGLGKYKKAIAECEVLAGYDDCIMLVYILWGNCLTEEGKVSEAIEVFLRGIERFPDSGELYEELGIIYFDKKEFDEALTWFNRAIEKNPELAASYYYAAYCYYSASPEKIWSLVYAETAILLNNDGDSNHEAMAKLIITTFKGNIQADSEQFAMRMSKAGPMITGDNPVRLDFPKLYEACLREGFRQQYIYDDGEVPACMLDTLLYVRYIALETYFKEAGHIFGNSMYLLEYQKKILDAGFFDAYNVYLLGSQFPIEVEYWINNNKGEMERFMEWYNNNPFRLDRTHTVGRKSIYRDQANLSHYEAMQIQTALTTPWSPKDISEQIAAN